MAKKRTLTINPFLNENLKPVKEETGLRGLPLKYYSLYYRVTYNRQGTMIKSRFEDSYTDISAVSKRILDEEQSLIRAIIDFETEGFIGDFNLTKLKKKYETYSKEVHICLDEYIRSRVKKILSRSNDPAVNIINVGKYAPENPVTILVEVCQKLIKNFDKLAGEEFEFDLLSYKAFIRVFNLKRMTYKPIITDWLSNKTQVEMKNKLKEEKMLVRDINAIISNITNILIGSIK